MEPLLMILVPGLIGGVVLSLFITRLRRTTPPTFVPKRLEAPSPSLINMSSIKVEGLGGLGMVANSRFCLEQFDPTSRRDASVRDHHG